MNRPIALSDAHPRKAKSVWRTPLWIIRLFNYEYWPVWIVFFPAIVYYFFLALKAKSFTYFTAANPGIELGGFFGESKGDILKAIPEKYLPVTCYFKDGVSLQAIRQEMKLKLLEFPVICKPDKGERGFLVEKIHDEQELENYLSYFSGELIVQEFVSYETELGILYYCFPDGSGSGISSVVIKEFLSVTGDGTSTMEQLILNSARARFQLPALRNKFGDKLSDVLPLGVSFLLEPIGNHCRGTRFLNGEKLITEQLVKVFDEIAARMNGFYFGRFDLKVKSIDDLYRGEYIRIMEVNGTTSEPAHIYGPDMNLMKAWSAILYNTRLIYEIARQNNKRGIAYTPLKEAIQRVRSHFKNKG